MAATRVVQLARLMLSSGESRSLEVDVPIEPFRFAGQDYAPIQAIVPARVGADRTVGGWALRLRVSASLEGPCTRCLGQAELTVDVDAREIDQPKDPELCSPYVIDDELDVAAWARDAIALELPAHILCSDDCLGLCPVCGENLNGAGSDHAHDSGPDPRWAKLSELRLD